MMFKAICGLLLAAHVSGHGTVYVIRHGEKKWKLGCLNETGKARADNLISVFSGQPSQTRPTFEAPHAIFANWYHDPVNCERCNQTVAPISTALGLTTDVTHGGGHPGSAPNGGNKGAATAILQKLKSVDGPVLVVWEHLNIKWLVEALGIKWANIPPWHEEDYDTVYILDYDKAHLNIWSNDAKPVNFRRANQNFECGHANHNFCNHNLMPDEIKLV